MINPAMLWKLKSMRQRFTNDHPKFPAFLQALRTRGLSEGTVLAMTVTYPDGSTMETNLKLTADDIAAYQEILSMSQKMQ
ncbi:MAG: hypothetical protein E7280_00525 [Lachnospiraceae bacterium]|nr:hypothetical protein [Lachnospiraceae bacterium]